MAVAVCANDHHPAVACTAPQLKSTLLVYKGAVVTLRNVTFAANKPSSVRPPRACRTRAPAAHCGAHLFMAMLRRGGAPCRLLTDRPTLPTRPRSTPSTATITAHITITTSPTPTTPRTRPRWVARAARQMTEGRLEAT